MGIVRVACSSCAAVAGLDGEVKVADAKVVVETSRADNDDGATDDLEG